MSRELEAKGRKSVSSKDVKEVFEKPSHNPEWVKATGGASVLSSLLGSARSRSFQAACALLAIVIFVFVSSQPTFDTTHNILTSAVARSIKAVSSNGTSLLEVFQVYPPVLTVTADGIFEITDGSANTTVQLVNDKKQSCAEEIAVYSFANSYGAPFVGEYTPPSCQFNRVTWNLTVVEAGRQYDRLGIVYLGNVEVFRTSTAEPTAEGIKWTYIKDMTSYLSLFQTNQKVIFDLGNIVNDLYTAAINVTLTATFFTASDTIEPADLIVPISARNAAQNQASVFTVPPNTASNKFRLPQNIKRAVVTVAATGQSEEEFWWSNVPQSDIYTYNGTELYGYSPFREVQLFIDGSLAGVAWPFPIIFTGGVVPGLWRPIVGIDAFDLREDEIDVTPWLPLLCDGKSHNFTIRVSGLNDDGNGKAVLSETTDSYWLVTGKVFVWLDEQGHVTKGDGPIMHTPAPDFSVKSTITKASNGTNETLLYQVDAARTLSFQSTLHLSTGKETVFWRQNLEYSNVGNYTDEGNIETNTQQTSGLDVSSSGYMRQFSYPLYAFSTYSSEGDNITLSANVNRGKHVKTLGQPVFPTGLESFQPTKFAHKYPAFEGAALYTTQNGSATYLANETAETSFSFGTTKQDFLFEGLEVHSRGQPFSFPSIAGTTELFHRYVEAVNGSVVTDNELLLDETVPHRHIAQPDDSRGFAMKPWPAHGLREQPGSAHHG